MDEGGATQRPYTPRHASQQETRPEIGHEVGQETRPISQAEPSTVRFDALLTLTRLAIGGALETADGLGELLLGWQEQARRVSDGAPNGESNGTARTEPGQNHRLRSALVGLLFEAEDRAELRLGRLADATSRLTQRVSGGLAPVWRRVPGAKRVGTLIASGQAATDRWVARGQIEEYEGRLLARQGAASLTGLVDDVLDYLAHDPAVRELIEQESVGVARDAVESVREHARSSDRLAVRVARVLLRPPTSARSMHSREGKTGLETSGARHGQPE